MTDILGQILLNRYRIDALLGRGGMAEVYKAWDQRRQYAVAIKVMREDLAEDLEFLNRFRSEARSLSDLSHANIVRFYSFERQGHLAFMVMDYIPGITLRRRILEADGHPMPLEEVLSVVRQVGAALYYAHSEGLIHRDVKPGNIMLQPDGRVLLSDFGIAKAADAATVTTLMPGTPAYMSPEQCRSQLLDERTDLYSLGIVVYEMLAGRRPFVGEGGGTTGSTSDKVRWEHLNSAPPSLRQFNPQVTPEIEASVLGCLQKRPAERFRSVLEFVQAFEQKCQGVAGAGPLVAPVEILKQPPQVMPLEPQKPVQKDALQARKAVQPEAVVAAVLPLKDGSDVHNQPAPTSTTAESPSGRPFNWQAAVAWMLLLGIVIVIGFIYLRPKPALTETAGAMLETQISDTPTPTNIPTNTATATNTTTATSTATVTSTFTPTPTRTATFTPTPTQDPLVPPATANLGDTWQRPQDGMQMVYIPAGEFLMGSVDSDSQANDDEKPQHTVYLDAFWIDQTEITNAMFRRFIQQSGYSFNLQVGSDLDNHPVVYIPWEAASSYCQWADAHLPSEAQWEKAARGPDGRIYPWGNIFDGSRLNFCDRNCGGDKTVDDGWATTAPVGSYPAGASPYGALDMAGNVWEWVQDRYNENYYSASPLQNPIGPNNGGYNVIRGGSWSSIAKNTRITNRDRDIPTYIYDIFGFRCAR